MVDILIRPFLPQSLDLIARMSPAIISAGERYGVDPVAIAGAIALEQNNAEQFRIKYSILDVVSGLAFRNGVTGDNAISAETETLWTLVDEPIVNKHVGTIDELDKIIGERCAALTNERAIIKSRAGFHWWPKIAKPK